MYSACLKEGSSSRYRFWSCANVSASRYICTHIISLSYSVAAIISVIPDRVACPESDPLWNWSILLLCFGELHLRSERLVGLRVLISCGSHLVCANYTYRHLDCLLLMSLKMILDSLTILTLLQSNSKWARRVYPMAWHCGGTCAFSCLASLHVPCLYLCAICETLWSRTNSQHESSNLSQLGPTVIPPSRAAREPF